MPDSVVLPPQAARTIEGLRDTGYETRRCTRGHRRQFDSG